MNRTNSRQQQWWRQPGTSTDMPCCPESVVCTDQVDYVVYIVPWPSCPPIVGFRPPKPCTNPYPHPWNTLTHGKGMGLHWVRVKVGAKTPVGYPCPSLGVAYMSTPTLETHEALQDYGIGTRSVQGAKFQRQGGCNHGNDYYSSHTVSYIGCTGWEYNFSVILPFGLGGSLCILGTAYTELGKPVTKLSQATFSGKPKSGLAQLFPAQLSWLSHWELSHSNTMKSYQKETEEDRKSQGGSWEKQTRPTLKKFSLAHWVRPRV